MAKLIPLILIVTIFLFIDICQCQSLAKQAAASRAKCEQGLRDKGCTGITSSCDIKQYSYRCSCNASSCPTNGSSGGSSNKKRQVIRTKGCGTEGPSRCPQGYCCGPASYGSPDNMKICYPPGSPC